MAVAPSALKNGISRIPAKVVYSRISPLVWITVFTGVLLVLEFLNLHDEGWDESTFIIMASHVLEGNLPYLELYDLKPPGFFLVLAGVMGVFGENLPVVHLFGAFCLLVAATAGYAIAVRQTTPLMAGAAMTAFCALTYEVEFQETLTEHLALAFMMPACWLLVARQQLWAAFLIGLFISAATLTRTNLAYVALALGGVYLWRCVKPRSETPGMAVAAYIAGGAIPLTCLLLAYWLAGGMDTLVLATVEVPLSFASSQLGMTEAFARQKMYWSGRMDELPFIFLPATAFICGVALLGRSACRGENGPLLVVFGAVLLSVLRSGAAWGHYLLQALPLAIVLAVIGFGNRPRGVVPCVVLSVLIVGGVAFEAGRNGFVPYRPSSMERTADVIRQDRCCGELVYASRHHLIYWYLKQRPPSPIVHPTSFVRDAVMKPLTERGYVGAAEWWLIFERNIGYIVLDRGDWRGRYYSVEQEQHLGNVLRDFHLWREVGRLAVYRRNR